MFEVNYKTYRNQTKYNSAELWETKEEAVEIIFQIIVNSFGQYDYKFFTIEITNV